MDEKTIEYIDKLEKEINELNDKISQCNNFLFLYLHIILLYIICIYIVCKLI